MDLSDFPIHVAVDLVALVQVKLILGLKYDTETWQDFSCHHSLEKNHQGFFLTCNSMARSNWGGVAGPVDLIACLLLIVSHLHWSIFLVQNESKVTNWYGMWRRNNEAIWSAEGR